ncbi:MAG: hypothetical protein ABIS68_12310 [Casimicrobiaceae bacterium]
MKRSLYARHPADIAAYVAGKQPWIGLVEPLAIAWFRSKFPPLTPQPCKRTTRSPTKKVEAAVEEG